MDRLHRLDLTRMTMTRGMSKHGTFGAVARIRDGVFPTFVLNTPCTIVTIADGREIVLRVSNAVDRAALLRLQNSLVILLVSLVVTPLGSVTCSDATAMVRRVVAETSRGVVHTLVCAPRDDADDQPVRVHVRRGGVDADSIERDVGFDRLRVGQSVFPVFHVRGAFMDAATDRLVPRITVSEVIVCCGGDDGTTSGEDLQEARTPT